MKHTKGPWRFNSATQDVENEAGDTVAFPRSGGHCPGEFSSKVEANARLIAAAPELIAFAEHVLREQLALGDQGDAEYVRMASDLVAKIKGDV